MTFEVAGRKLKYTQPSTYTREKEKLLKSPKKFDVKTFIEETSEIYNLSISDDLRKKYELTNEIRKKMNSTSNLILSVFYKIIHEDCYLRNNTDVLLNTLKEKAIAELNRLYEKGELYLKGSIEGNKAVLKFFKKHVDSLDEPQKACFLAALDQSVLAEIFSRLLIELYKAELIGLANKLTQAQPSLKHKLFLSQNELTSQQELTLENNETVIFTLKLDLKTYQITEASIQSEDEELSKFLSKGLSNISRVKQAIASKSGKAEFDRIFDSYAHLLKKQKQANLI